MEVCQRIREISDVPIIMVTAKDNDMDKIMGLNHQEVIAVVELHKLAQKAKVISDLIYKAYKCFGIGETKITVWSDGNNFEYLTYDGVWQARYLHQNYDVTCTPDGIFDVMKAAYLFSQDEHNHKLREMAAAHNYFMSFARKTAQKAGVNIDDDNGSYSYL
jgi:hypothetical protein